MLMILCVISPMYLSLGTMSRYFVHSWLSIKMFMGVGHQEGRLLKPLLETTTDKKTKMQPENP